MNIKRFSLTTLVLIAVTLALLVGAFGLIVGRAQAPRAKSTLVPTIAVVTPTPESEPGLASVQGHMGLKAGYIRHQVGHVVLRDVGQVGQDKVKGAIQRSQQVAAYQVEPLGEAVAHGVLPGHH